ncbi:MAG TPA: aspartate carbamoyltransferase catalytic subunit [Candidatus Saccharimonadales bacterium]|nr:aspartate carbamoyltransferase catalytic subunit [Candidatus Saccharimonadales bacterium]
MASRSASWTDRGAFPLRHLTGLRGLPAAALRTLLDAAREVRAQGLDAHAGVAPGRQAALLFYENSTRTRMSFESAVARLGGTPLVLNADTSSARKGESLRDTGRVLEAQGIEILIVRHPDPDASDYLSTQVDIPVVNAGSGTGEHPTQALLDILTLEDALGPLAGKRVVLVGDIAHSRVARSNLYGLTTLGASVVFCGPPTLVTPGWRELGAEVTFDLSRALEGAHAVMGLRLQGERLHGEAPATSGTLRARYGLTLEHLRRRPDLFVLHPGPVQRGVEMTHEVADSSQSLILDQVRNGTFVRMAVLGLLWRAGQARPAPPPAPPAEGARRPRQEVGR